MIADYLYTKVRIRRGWLFLLIFMVAGGLFNTWLALQLATQLHPIAPPPHHYLEAHPSLKV